jgi:hypothetical protein
MTDHVPDPNLSSMVKINLNRFSSSTQPRSDPQSLQIASKWSEAFDFFQ